MSEPITDRELERLALGELDEREAELLLGRLEERGELERFEALVADDESFLDAHPPALLAAQVREEVRRRARANTPKKEESMLSVSKRPLVLGLATAAFAAVIVGVFALVAPEPPAIDPIADAATNNQPTTATQVEENEVAAVMPAEAPKTDPITILDYKDEYPLPPTFYMAVGDIMTISAKGVQNVQIGVTKVMDVTSTGDRLYVEAKSSGNSMLTVARERRGKDGRSAMIIVGEPIPKEQLQAAAESEPSLLSCGTADDGVVTLRIVTQMNSVFIGNAHAAGEPLRPKLRACIDGIVGNWEFQGAEPPTGTNGGLMRGLRELSVGKLRFNFGAGAVCEPGEDC